MSNSFNTSKLFQYFNFIEFTLHYALEKEVIFKWLIGFEKNLFWHFICPPQVQVFIQKCEEVKPNTVGVCGDRPLRAADTHTQIRKKKVEQNRGVMCLSAGRNEGQVSGWYSRT